MLIQLSYVTSFFFQTIFRTLQGPKEFSKLLILEYFDLHFYRVILYAFQEEKEKCRSVYTPSRAAHSDRSMNLAR